MDFLNKGEFNMGEFIGRNRVGVDNFQAGGEFDFSDSFGPQGTGLNFNDIVGNNYFFFFIAFILNKVYHYN